MARRIEQHDPLASAALLIGKSRAKFHTPLCRGGKMPDRTPPIFQDAKINYPLVEYGDAAYICYVPNEEDSVKRLVRIMRNPCVSSVVFGPL